MTIGNHGVVLTKKDAVNLLDQLEFDKKEGSSVEEVKAAKAFLTQKNFKDKTGNEVAFCNNAQSITAKSLSALVELLKPRIGWESRKKIEEELTRLKEQLSEYKGEFTKKEFEDMKKDLEG